MSGRSSIEWTGYTWNPIRARLKKGTLVNLTRASVKAMPAGTWGYHCERVSPGCQRCYAERGNGRTLPVWGTGLDYTRASRDKVEIYLDEQELLKPLHWKRPRFVFPCSMTDLFAEFVPDEFIDKMFAVMALCPQHTFQVLTKRASRLPEFFADLNFRNEMLGISAELWSGLDRHFDGPGTTPGYGVTWRLPFKNVWLGVSVEDRQRYRERVTLLRQTPAAVRWLSIEPLLEDLGEIDLTGIDWVVLGGESGPGARPCDLAWLRSVRDQCAAAGVPCFVKQLGARPFIGHSLHKQIHHRMCDGNLYLKLDDRKGGTMEEWPADLRVREMPAAAGARDAT